MVVMNVDGQESVYCILHGVRRKTLYLMHRRSGHSTTHVTRVKNEFCDRKKQFDQQIHRFRPTTVRNYYFPKADGTVWRFSRSIKKNIVVNYTIIVGGCLYFYFRDENVTQTDMNCEGGWNWIDEIFSKSIILTP